MLELTFIGNVGNDPESQVAKSGKDYTTFSVAINNGYFDKKTGEWKELDTTWIRCIAFDYNADKAAKLSKGEQVFVKGRPGCHGYENNEGNIVATLQCMVQNMRSFGRRERAENSEDFRPQRRSRRREQRR